MPNVRGVPNLANQVVAVNAGVAGTNSVAGGANPTNVVDGSSISSVPQKTKATHFFTGAAGAGALTITVFYSNDGINWFTKAGNAYQAAVLANANGGLAAIETDGSYPFYSHQITGNGAGALINSFIY